MKPLHSFPLRAAFAALIAVALLAGCQRVADMRNRMRKKAEKEAAQRAVSEKSEEIWKESTTRKAAEEEASRLARSKLTVGDRTLRFTRISLILGQPKTPGDLGGGRAPSEIQCTSTNGPSLHIKALPLEASQTYDNLAGQSCQITPEMSANTELVTEDGTKWRLQDALVEFRKVEQDTVSFFVEGKAVDASGQRPDPVDVNGELHAKVIDAGAKP